MSASGRTPVTCPVCGAGIHPKDRFCGACGADVAASGAASGSLFDELMPQDDRHTAPTPAGGYRVPDADPGDEGYGDAEYGDDPYGHEHHGDPGYRGEPSDAGYAPTAVHDGAAHRDDRAPAEDDGPSRASVLLPLVILVLVVVAAVVAWQLAPRGDGGSGTASGGTSSQSAGGSSADASGGGSASPSNGSEPQQVEMASTAKRCDNVGDAVAYRGNDVTSCDFAVQVAQALLDADPDLPATVTARSPVTKKSYDMTCENTVPVTCRGGNDALVYVDRG